MASLRHQQFRLRRGGVGRFAVWLLGFLLAGAAAAGMLAAAYRASNRDRARLERAAQAVVVRKPSRPASATLAPKGWNGRTLTVPIALHFDRQRAVLLALESERLRHQTVAALDSASDRPGRGASGQLGDRQVLELAATYLFARQRLAQYLKVDPCRAQILLHALGWPWLGGSEPEPKADATERAQLMGDGERLEQSLAALIETPEQAISTGGAWPAPLTVFSSAHRAELVDVAEDAPAWPAARQTLQSRFGLSGEQTFALRAHLCRQAVADAFRSARGLRHARDALGKYADLASAQAETVLAMAGALELVRAGRGACATLEAMLQETPDLAGPLLRAAVERDDGRRCLPEGVEGQE